MVIGEERQGSRPKNAATHRGAARELSAESERRLCANRFRGDGATSTSGEVRPLHDGGLDVQRRRQEKRLGVWAGQQRPDHAALSAVGLLCDLVGHWGFCIPHPGDQRHAGDTVQSLLQAVSRDDPVGPFSQGNLLRSVHPQLLLHRRADHEAPLDVGACDALEEGARRGGLRLKQGPDLHPVVPLVLPAHRLVRGNSLRGSLQLGLRGLQVPCWFLLVLLVLYGVHGDDGDPRCCLQGGSRILGLLAKERERVRRLRL
mmetsp:Transcript_63013/g.136824  ORF Transcript_63013/g.136824 Transcript_63013/m.136824 type:complete len:259 (-) Transcript_63013:1543-2319(-)